MKLTRFVPKHILMICALTLPMVFLGAQCNTTDPPIVPLGSNTLEANVSVEGAFSSQEAQARDLSKLGGGDYILIHAEESSISGKRVIEFEVPKKATIPYTVALNTTDKGYLSYCLEAAVGTCKTFIANKSQGTASVTITKLTSLSVEGSFSGTVPSVPSGVDPDRVVTDGAFNVDFVD